MPLTLYWSFWGYMRGKQNTKAASVCVCVYICTYVYNEGPYGQLGPDKCHLKQNTFNWWISACNKWCKYVFIRNGLVSTVPFKYSHCKSDVWLTVHRNSVWIRKTNLMSLFVFFISLLIVAQHVSDNHVPIIRSWRLRDVIASCWYVPWLQEGW